MNRDMAVNLLRAAVKGLIRAAAKKAERDGDYADALLLYALDAAIL